MRPPTPSCNDSSQASAPPFTLEWRGSRALWLHWWVLHVGAIVAVATTYPISFLGKILVSVGVLGHACLRTPSSCGRLLRTPDGRWAVPERGVFGFELHTRTRYAGWWVHLVLSAPGRRFELVLLYDQVDAAQWSALLVGLRTGNWVAVPAPRLAR
jgi:hypothetical protein